MKNFLNKRFKHNTWFKEGVTVGYALNYFAKVSDFYLDKKPALKQSENLLDAVVYDDVITDGKRFYRLSKEEKQYYLKIKEYWKEKELSSYLCCNSNYDIEAAEMQLEYAQRNNDKERIDYWETQVQIRQKKHKFIDGFINMFFDKVITNKDFIDFKDKLQSELENI